jgi:quinol monooxygenase YgiN
MVIRLFHGKVRTGRQTEFRKTLELLSIPNIQSKRGMIAFYPGQPVGPGGDEFVLVTIWKDQAAQDNDQSDNWVKAIIPEEALALLDEWHVSGYKSFGVLEQPLKPLFQSL